MNISCEHLANNLDFCCWKTGSCGITINDNGREKTRTDNKRKRCVLPCSCAEIWQICTKNVFSHIHLYKKHQAAVLLKSYRDQYQEL